MDLQEIEEVEHDIPLHDIQWTFSDPPEDHQCHDLHSSGRREFLVVLLCPLNLRYLPDAMGFVVADKDIPFSITCDSMWPSE